MPKTLTIKEFIVLHKMSMTAKPVESNPHMTDDGHRMRHWLCEIRKGRRMFPTHFSMGEAFEREPEIAEVLDCLASDASGYENNKDFEGWAGEYGYDTDSRKAEKTFRAVRHQSVMLEHFLGIEAYRQLIEQVEKL